MQRKDRRSPLAPWCALHIETPCLLTETEPTAQTPCCGGGQASSRSTDYIMAFCGMVDFEQMALVGMEGFGSRKARASCSERGWRLPMPPLRKKEAENPRRCIDRGECE